MCFFNINRPNYDERTLLQILRVSSLSCGINSLKKTSSLKLSVAMTFDFMPGQSLMDSKLFPLLNFTHKDWVSNTSLTNNGTCFSFTIPQHQLHHQLPQLACIYFQPYQCLCKSFKSANLLNLLHICVYFQYPSLIHEYFMNNLQRQ